MEKYLQHYAEPETGQLDAAFTGRRWENVLVVPACNECADFLRAVPPCGGRSLLILIINESIAANRTVSQANEALAAAVQDGLKPVWQSAPETGLSLLHDARVPRDILLVDRFSAGLRLPAGSGVGLARKIGADLATRLIYQGNIRSRWIHCSDADVELPDTYFRFSNALQDPGSQYAALVYPYRHGDDPDRAENAAVILATQLYELSLRYYVAGMKFAGSPYAFHTIGSTMAVSAPHYAKVRGFPKREAGEDFYLLNKLAKVGTVFETTPGPDCEPIEIEARYSDRVPFGTGAAVNKINTLADPVTDFQFYDPTVFELLKYWLQCLPGIWQSQSSSLSSSTFTDHPGVHIDSHGRQHLLAGLRAIRTERALEHAFRQGKSSAQFMRQMHTWFDAFRTLKLIHFLRDSYLPTMPYAMLIKHRVFQQLLDDDAGLDTFHGQLRLKLQLD
ncbi:MAG: hypothetical protein KJO80_13655 [Gammaproteobacteria bacterium]|nr:hypothetical protein [Gammaproteobacteria bacterium]